MAQLLILNLQPSVWSRFSRSKEPAELLQLFSLLQTIFLQIRTSIYNRVMVAAGVVVPLLPCFKLPLMTWPLTGLVWAPHETIRTLFWQLPPVVYPLLLFFCCCLNIYWLCTKIGVKTGYWLRSHMLLFFFLFCPHVWHQDLQQHPLSFL